MVRHNPSEHFQRNLRHIFVLIMLALSGCVAHQVKESTWPEDLPPRAYFLKQYQQDTVNKNIQNQEEYLTWIIRFYKGWELYPSGWNNITQEVLLKLKNRQAANKVKVKMERLGLLISEEWAKNNKTRIINTRHVSVWGSALLKSLDHDETLQLIDRVSMDIDNLLAHKIAVDAIAADRYYAQDEEIL